LGLHRLLEVVDFAGFQVKLAGPATRHLFLEFGHDDVAAHEFPRIFVAVENVDTGHIERFQLAHGLDGGVGRVFNRAGDGVASTLAIGVANLQIFQQPEEVEYLVCRVCFDVILPRSGDELAPIWDCQSTLLEV
jgi:hypothetical protein